jgi:hypothetical protein
MSMAGWLFQINKERMQIIRLAGYVFPNSRQSAIKRTELALLRNNFVSSLLLGLVHPVICGH